MLEDLNAGIVAADEELSQAQESYNEVLASAVCETAMGPRASNLSNIGRKSVLQIMISEARSYRKVLHASLTQEVVNVT